MALNIPTNTGDEIPSTFLAQLKADMATLEATMAAVLSGATAQLLPAASKVPLADSTGRIDPNWMSPVTALVDWNNYLENGVFIGNGLLNAPAQITGASITIYVEVIKFSANYSIQIARDLQGKSIQQRVYVVGTWSAWKVVGAYGRRATVYDTAGITFASGAWNVIPFNTITMNENTPEIVLAANTIAAPSWARKAYVRVTTAFTAAPATNGRTILRATNNGATSGIPNWTQEYLNNASDLIVHECDFIVAAGDLIGASIQHYDTANRTTSGASGFSSMSVEFA